MLTEGQAYIQAVEWVTDELELNSCMEGADAVHYASGFVTGFRLGLHKGSQGSLLVQGDTAEAFWRGNLRDALEWERSKVHVEVGS